MFFNVLNVYFYFMVIIVLPDIGCGKSGRAFTDLLVFIQNASNLQQLYLSAKLIPPTITIQSSSNVATSCVYLDAYMIEN